MLKPVIDFCDIVSGHSVIMDKNFLVDQIKTNDIRCSNSDIYVLNDVLDDSAFTCDNSEMFDDSFIHFDSAELADPNPE